MVAVVAVVAVLTVVAVVAVASVVSVVTVVAVVAALPPSRVDESRRDEGAAAGVLGFHEDDSRR